MTDADANRILFHVLETVECSLCIFEVACSGMQRPELTRTCCQTLKDARAAHESLLGSFEDLGLDAGEESAARRLIRYRAQALIDLMQMTREELSADEAEVIAADVLAETQLKLSLNLRELESIGSRGPRRYADCLRKRGLIGPEAGRLSYPPDPHWFAMPTRMLEMGNHAPR